MKAGLDITDIDWNNPDVNRAFEYFSSRVDDVRNTTKQQTEELRRLKEELRSAKEENKNLKEEILRLKAGSKSRKKARSYNTRKYKEYPRPKSTKKKPSYGTATEAVQMTADQKCCPKCGLPLSDPTSEYGRCVEDVVDGKWSNMEWTSIRRYCKYARNSGQPPYQMCFQRSTSAST